MKKRNLVITLLLVLGMISITIGVSVAFFNYTRTGSANILAVGKVNFNSSQGTSINLTNVFPIKSTEIENNPNATSVTISISGDTTYNDGIEYLISANQVINTINNKKIPIGVKVSAINLGTEDTDYFDNRGGNTSIYKIFSMGTIKENGELVVGYITKGATGINGNVTLTFFIDADKIAITDTPDENSEWQEGRTVFSTSEWNSFNSSGLSFKLKVEANEGVWVDNPLTLYGELKKNVDKTTLINFSENSSSTNGEGIYMLPGTGNNQYPIYYYRGDVKNNNVYFAGFCWQMMRSTDTGGVKMIYNGLPDIEGSGDNTTYNCGITRNIQNKFLKEISLGYTPAKYFADDYEIDHSLGSTALYKLKSKNKPLTQVAVTSENGATTIPDIAANYPYTCLGTTENFGCTSLYKVVSYANGPSANVYSSSDISIIADDGFNYYSDNVSDVGYMSNEVYDFNAGDLWKATALFGSDVTWNGTSYSLIDATVSTPDATHHYSCNATVADATCTDLRYVYYVSGNLKYFIVLNNGEKVEDALYKMTVNGTDEIKLKYSNYNLNENDSYMKETLENWFKTNLTNEVNSNNKDYRAYLEDTEFCNDRSFKTLEGNANNPVFANSGWNPNGINTNAHLYFGSNNRTYNAWYSETNVPSMNCPREVDRFTVSNANGNGALTYPIGLITVDEVILAGESGQGENNNAYYLYTGGNYWTMSPQYFGSYTAYVTTVNKFGHLYGDAVTYMNGVRPVISLQYGTEFIEGGDGTATNPFVIKYD